MSIEPKPGTGTCHLCEPAADVPTVDLVNHIRVMHPDQYEPVECWPDGAPVVTYDEITPENISPP